MLVVLKAMQLKQSTVNAVRVKFIKMQILEIMSAVQREVL